VFNELVKFSITIRSNMYRPRCFTSNSDTTINESRDIVSSKYSYFNIRNAKTC